MPAQNASPSRPNDANNDAERRRHQSNDAIKEYHQTTPRSLPEGSKCTMPSKKPEKWGTSESKALLRSGILSGAITSRMKPKEVYDMNPRIHGAWTYINWSNNLRNLRLAIVRDRGRMARDAIAYGQTFPIARAILPQSTADRPVWHLTAAPQLLKQDIDDNKHKQMPPRELHQTRPEYQLFPLSQFRKHIYQEADSRPKKAIRFEKKKQKWLYPELHVDHPRLRDNSE